MGEMKDKESFYKMSIAFNTFFYLGLTTQYSIKKLSAYSSSYLTTKENNNPPQGKKHEINIVILPNITLHEVTTDCLEIHNFLKQQTDN